MERLKSLAMATASKCYHVGGAAPCLFLVIGCIFMVTAPYNWHETLLTNACTAEVPLEDGDFVLQPPSTRRM